MAEVRAAEAAIERLDDLEDRRLASDAALVQQPGPSKMKNASFFSLPQKPIRSFENEFCVDLMPRAAPGSKAPKDIEGAARSEELRAGYLCEN